MFTLTRAILILGTVLVDEHTVKQFSSGAPSDDRGLQLSSDVEVFSSFQLASR